MEAKEFIAKRRRTVRLPDGSEFVICKIGVSDVLIADGNPNLMTFLQGKSRRKQIEVLAEKAKELDERHKKDIKAYAKFCKAIVMRGVVEPRITPTGSDDTVAISILTFDECDMLAGAILKFSGFTKEAAETIAPLPKTARSSSSSTPSPHATDADRAGSSEHAIPSRDTPSISPAPGQASIGTERKPSA